MKKQNLFSRSWSEVTSGDRNEIVFDHEYSGLNKTYGAYEIRTNYDSTLTKAFSFTLLFVGLFSASLLLIRALPAREMKIPDSNTFTCTITPPEKTFVPKPIEQPVSRASASTNNLKPEVSDERNIDENPIPKNLNSNVGTGNPIDTGNSEINFRITESKPETIDDEPLESTAVQELPEFPGGEDERQRFLQNNLHIPEVIRELGNIKEKVGISFVVKKDGNISDIEVLKGGSKYSELNGEALRVIKKMPVWKPGRQNGAPVNVRMIMPIQFVVK